MKLVLVLSILAAAAQAQLTDNRTPQLNCNNNNYGGKSQRFCEVREQTTAGVGRLTVDPGMNGGVTVRGWLRNDVLVRSAVEAWAPTADEARSLAALVR